MTTKETILSRYGQDIVDDVCEQLSIDLETLYIQMASHHIEMAKANTEANKQHHKHWLEAS